MLSSLENALCRKYPKIFVHLHNGSKDPISEFGIECPDGWYELIDELCSCIQTHVDWKTRDLDPDESEQAQVVFKQVKQAHGYLRIYAEGIDDAVRGMISFAGSMSQYFCENCGGRGCQIHAETVRVLCDNCHEEELESHE